MARIVFPQENPNQDNFGVSHSSLVEVGGKSVQIRFIQAQGVTLPVPIIDKEIGLNPSVDFLNRAKKLVGILNRAQCSPTIDGYLRSCGFYDEKTSGGTERNIYRDTTIGSGDAQVAGPNEFSELLGITINSSNQEYQDYRYALHKSNAYSNTNTFMTDFTKWLTEIYNKKNRLKTA